MNTLQRAALYFAAAALGGLAVVLTAWAFGQIGIADALGLPLKPGLDKNFIYRMMVWGGIWGMLFLIPVPIRPLWLKGLIMTLAPVLAAFLIFIPMAGGQPFALQWGILAPFYIYVVNAPWGLVTAYLGRALGADSSAA
jgi:hypothetical protein